MEEYLEKDMKLFAAVMDLKKAYDSWQESGRHYEMHVRSMAGV